MYIYLFKDTITASEPEVQDAIEFALDWAGYDEDDGTLPPAYVAETEDGKYAVCRNNRGINANPTSSEVLADGFNTEAEAQAYASEENAANRPKPEIIELPAGVEFVACEDLETRDGERGFAVTIRRANGELVTETAWGETSYGRSGVEGARHALNKALGRLRASARGEQQACVSVLTPPPAVKRGA